jgi:predicted Zn-dependent peptidase
MTTRPPRPIVGPPTQWTFPTPTRTTLENGLGIVSYDVPGQYVASVRLAVPLPLRSETFEQEGVATMMARTLDEGTSVHSSSQMASLLERSGAVLAPSMGESGLSVDLDVPVAMLGTALDLMRQCLVDPVFPEPEVHRHVQTRLAEIEQDRSSPGRRAALEMVRTLFDPADRASRPAGGRVETVSALDPGVVAAFHRDHLAARGATLAIAGDLPEGVVDLISGTLGQWRGNEWVTHEPAMAPRYAANRARIVVVDRPGSVQAELSVAAPGPDRRVSTGWAAYPVLSFLVGGSPSARVDAVLREDKGYTYGIRSGFRPRRAGGIFATAGSVRADVTVEALDLLLGILDGAREGFTADETRRGVDFIAKTAPGRFATADAIADEASTMALDGLTTDFTTKTLRDLQALTPDMLTQAYCDVVDGSWTVVVVADADSVVDGLTALGRGPVSVVPA